MPQKNDDEDINLKLFISLCAVLGIFGVKYGILDKINTITYNIIQIFTNPKGIAYVSIIFLAISFCSFMIVKIYKMTSYEIKDRKEKRREKENQIYNIELILKKDLSDFNSSELISDFIVALYKQLNLIKKYEYLQNYKKILEDRTEEANNLFLELKKEEEAKEERQHLIEEQERIKEEEKEREWEKQLEEERTKKNTLEILDIENNYVYKKEELNENQIFVLKEIGFTQVNEYCPIEHKNITVLVKKVLNHSPTHTFLVERIAELVKTFSGVSDVQIHKTRDADITFKYINQIYSIEVETGSLLEQPKQLRAKVAYLTSRYKNRWMFVISNEKLYPKYRGFGSVSPRRWVRKNIEKMLKISTQHLTGVNAFHRR